MPKLIFKVIDILIGVIIKLNMMINLFIVFYIDIQVLKNLKWIMKSIKLFNSSFLNFIMPCEDDDFYTITKNKEHLGGARTIFSI